MIIKLTIIIINRYEWVCLEQAVDIAPVHTILSQIMISVITDRDVLTDGDDIEILDFQKHMVAVDANGVTFVVRSPVSTHDTLVTGIGVRHSKL